MAGTFTSQTVLKEHEVSSAILPAGIWESIETIRVSRLSSANYCRLYAAGSPSSPGRVGLGSDRFAAELSKTRGGGRHMVDERV
jgi:hypothetical protein